MGNKWTKELNKLSGAVTEYIDPHAPENVLQTSSPTVNSIFGNGWGMPRRFSMLLWGPPKAGKSLLCNDIIGRVHQRDPEAMVIKFDTEARTTGQLNPKNLTGYGIDEDRLKTYEVNTPEEVYDRIQNDIGALIDKGMPVPLIIIDSITGVLGRRESESESIGNQQRGDDALTTSIGLKRILMTQRRKNIALIVTAHARVEQDPWKQKKGQKTRAAVSFGAQHHCEYWVYIERNDTKAGKVDELGNEFVNEGKQDVTGTGEMTGHRIRVWMEESSMGPKNRSGEMTIDYERGIVNQHEEVLRLATKWGVIGHPNNLTYTYKDSKWNGKPATLKALAESPALQAEIITEMHRLDRIPGAIRNATDEEVEAEFRKAERAA